MSGDTPTANQEFSTPPEPRRSWLTPCTDAFGAFGMCVIEVEHGSIGVYAPDGSEGFHLGRNGITEFRAALARAVDVAEADLRAEAAAAPADA